MSSTKAKTIDELPELPFERILSYVSLEDRLKSRAVSRSWYHRINSFNMNKLCFSLCSGGFIWGKGRWIRDVFAQNLIGSVRLEEFFATFGPTILSNLKHLLLCDLNRLQPETMTALVQALNSSVQLEELDIFALHTISDRLSAFELNLPNLRSIRLEQVFSIGKLTVDAPRLREVRLLICDRLNLVIVNGESVERLLTDQLKYTEVKNLKNMQYFYKGDRSAIDPKLLSSLNQLKEFHTMDLGQVANLFEQKRRYVLTHLKIYLCGLLLDGPEDSVISTISNFNDFNDQVLRCLAEHPARLADEIPFIVHLNYEQFERVAPELMINLLKRFDSFELQVNRPVSSIERFLCFVKGVKNIVGLLFIGVDHNDQPQELFDRLPEHCAVQTLVIDAPLSDFRFLRRLKGLSMLVLNSPIRIECVRLVLEDLPFPFSFTFKYCSKRVEIRIGHSKRFWVEVGGISRRDLPDLDAVLRFIVGEPTEE